MPRPIHPMASWLLGGVGAARRTEGRMSGATPTQAARLRKSRRVKEEEAFVVMIRLVVECIGQPPGVTILNRNCLQSKDGRQTSPVGHDRNCWMGGAQA